MYYSKGAAGISPNVVTYTTLISCCQRGGQWARGMGLFRELEQLGVEMDMKLVNAMISACAKGAKWEDAWAITSSARRMGLRPNTRTYNALISACEKAGQADRALEVFERMCKDAGRLFPFRYLLSNLIGSEDCDVWGISAHCQWAGHLSYDENGDYLVLIESSCLQCHSGRLNHRWWPITHSWVRAPKWDTTIG